VEATASQEPILFGNANNSGLQTTTPQSTYIQSEPQMQALSSQQVQNQPSMVNSDNNFGLVVTLKQLHEKIYEYTGEQPTSYNNFYQSQTEESIPQALIDEVASTTINFIFVDATNTDDIAKEIADIRLVWFNKKSQPGRALCIILKLDSGYMPVVITPTFAKAGATSTHNNISDHEAFNYLNGASEWLYKKLTNVLAYFSARQAVVQILTKSLQASSNLSKNKNHEGLSYLYREPHPGKRTLVLQHGVFAGATETWFKLIPLLPKEYGIIVIDALGHGLSDYNPDASYDTIAQAQRIRQLLAAIKEIESFKNSDFIAVGHSLGNIMLQYIAINTPDLFKSLIGINPAFLGPEDTQTILNHDPDTEGHPFFPKSYEDVARTKNLIVPSTETNYYLNKAFSWFIPYTFPALYWMIEPQVEAEKTKMRAMWKTICTSNVFDNYRTEVRDKLKDIKIKQVYAFGNNDGIFRHENRRISIVEQYTNQSVTKIKSLDSGGHAAPQLTPKKACQVIMDTVDEPNPLCTIPFKEEL